MASKILENDLLNKGVLGMADKPGLSAKDMQYKFEEIQREIIIPKLNEVIGEVGSMLSPFDNEKTYAVGEYCIYKDELYKCIDAVTIPGTWNDKKWGVTTLSDALKDLQSQVDNAIKESANAVAEEAAARKAEIAIERARIDSIAKLPEGSTTGDAELIDGRVDYKGNTHTNIGEHIREVSSQLSGEIANVNEELGLYDVFHDKMEELKNWQNGNSISSNTSTSYKISDNVLTWTISTNASNPGVATKEFTWNDGKLYLIMDIESDSDVDIRVYGAKSYGHSTGNQVDKGKIIKKGRNLYIFDKSDFEAIDGDVRCLWFVFSRADGDNNEHVYTINELKVYQSPVFEKGFEGYSVSDFLIQLKSYTESLKESLKESVYEINKKNNLFEDYSDFVKWGATNDIVASNNSVTWSSIGDKGVALPISNIDQSALVRIEFDVEIAKSSDGYKFEVYVANSTKAANGFKVIKTITESGHYSVEFDASYYTVYEFEVNYVWFISHFHDEAQTTTIANLRVYQDKLEDNNLPSSIVDAIIQIQSNAEADTNNTQQYLIAPNGARYVAQVDSNGTFKAISVVPNKAFFMGNSLLLGFGEFGMAGSDVTKDYYYLINEAIKEQNPTYTASRLQASGWEGLTTIEEKNEYLNNTLLPHLSADLELIVVQLGDNVNTEEKKAVFAESAIDLLRFIRTNCPNARVAWMGAWYQTQTKMEQMINACNKTGSVFINIWDLRNTENSSAIGNTYTMADGTVKTITSEGVASHPGDKGFKAIANRALYTLGIVDNENYYQ